MRGRKYIDVVLKIRPPTLQNVLKIPLERAFLAQGRINAPPNQHYAAEIGVGIEYLHQFGQRTLQTSYGTGIRA